MAGGPCLLPAGKGWNSASDAGFACRPSFGQSVLGDLQFAQVFGTRAHVRPALARGQPGGRETTVVNLAASAALDGERVLLADMDKQGVSYAVGLITPPTNGDLANALVGSTALDSIGSPTLQGPRVE